MEAKHPAFPGGCTRLAVALAMAALLALPGCREDEDETIPAAPRAETAPLPQAPDWLELGDGRTPLAFMAQTSGLSESEVSPGLLALENRYRESPRMIANRVVQLWAEPPGPVPVLPQLMRDLLPPAGDGGRRSLGQVIQQYRVLREQGLDHAAAIAAAVPGDAK